MGGDVNNPTPIEHFISKRQAEIYKQYLEEVEVDAHGRAVNYYFVDTNPLNTKAEDVILRNEREAWRRA